MEGKKISTSLQSLKGIAAITVFLGHVLGMYQNEICQGIKRSPFAVFQDGQCAVTIFFMLTGFFCWREISFSWRQYGNSIWKKVVRIYPAYVLVMILGWFLANAQMQWDKSIFTDWGNSCWTEPVSITYLLKSCTLLLPFSTTTINPPIWYLYVDIRMAFILPVLYLIVRKTSVWVMLGMIVILLLFSKGSLLQYCAFYLAGGGIRYLYIHKTKLIETIFQGLRKWLCLIVGVALLDIFWIINSNYVDAPYWFQGFQMIGAGLIIGVIYVNDFGWLRKKLMLSLGNISYELYLVHFVVLLSLRPLSLPILWYILVSFAMSILLAVLLNRYVSQPARKILK